MEIQKTAKMKNAEKHILTRAICTALLTNNVFFSFLCFFQFCIVAEKTIKIGVQQKEKTKITTFYKLKTGPRISKKLVQVCCATSLDQFLAYTPVFFWGCFLLVFQNPLLSAGIMRQKNNKQKNGPVLTYKKANLGPVFNLTTYIYICVAAVFRSGSGKDLSELVMEFSAILRVFLTVHKLDVERKQGGCLQAACRVVNNQTPKKSTSRGLSIKLKSFLCGNPTETGESSKLNVWPPSNV